MIYIYIYTYKHKFVCAVAGRRHFITSCGRGPHLTSLRASTSQLLKPRTLGNCCEIYFSVLLYDIDFFLVRSIIIVNFFFFKMNITCISLPLWIQSLQSYCPLHDKNLNNKKKPKLIKSTLFRTKSLTNSFEIYCFILSLLYLHLQAKIQKIKNPLISLLLNKCPDFLFIVKNILKIGMNDLFHSRFNPNV